MVVVPKLHCHFERLSRQYGGVEKFNHKGTKESLSTLIPTHCHAELACSDTSGFQGLYLILTT